MNIRLNLESIALMLCCSDFIPTKIEPLTSDEWLEVEEKIKESPKKEVSALFGMNFEGLTQMIGLNEYLALKIVEREKLMNDLFYSLHNLENVGINVTTKYENNYPRQLLKLKNRMPLILYYVGDLSLINDDCVSIVGPQHLDKHLKASVNQCVHLVLKEKRHLVGSGIKGVDHEATREVLKNGGVVIEFLADHLVDRMVKVSKYISKGQMVILCAVDPFAYFDVTNSLDRNIYVCGLSKEQFVIATHINSGAVWFTSVQNLHYNWTKELVIQQSNLYNGNLRLMEMGAIPVYRSDFKAHLSIDEIIEKNEIMPDKDDPYIDQMSIYEFIDE